MSRKAQAQTKAEKEDPAREEEAFRAEEKEVTAHLVFGYRPQAAAAGE